jgi:hypothetical protein
MLVALDVALTTSNGDLLLAAFRAVAPLFAVTGRRNYTKVAARTLLELLGPNANADVRKILQYVASLRMRAGGPGHAHDAILEMLIGIIKRAMSIKKLSNEAICHHIATFQLHNKKMNEDLDFILSQLPTRSASTGEADRYRTRILAVAHRLEAILNNAQPDDILPGANSLHNDALLDDLLLLYPRGVLKMNAKLVAGHNSDQRQLLQEFEPEPRAAPKRKSREDGDDDDDDDDDDNDARKKNLTKKPRKENKTSKVAKKSSSKKNNRRRKTM